MPTMTMVMTHNQCHHHDKHLLQFCLQRLELHLLVSSTAALTAAVENKHRTVMNCGHATKMYSLKSSEC